MSVTKSEFVDRVASEAGIGEMEAEKAAEVTVQMVAEDLKQEIVKIINQALETFAK